MERYPNAQGEVEIFPPRGDRVLSELYRDDAPEPGIAQCFLVDRKIEVVDGEVAVREPDLENDLKAGRSPSPPVTALFGSLHTLSGS